MKRAHATSYTCVCVRMYAGCLGETSRPPRGRFPPVGRAAEQTIAHFNVVPSLPDMHIHDAAAPGSDTGRAGDEACFSECVTFPDQRIFLIKVPYPFYHAYPLPD